MVNIYTGDLFFFWYHLEIFIPFKFRATWKPWYGVYYPDVTVFAHRFYSVQDENSRFGVHTVGEKITYDQ